MGGLSLTYEWKTCPNQNGDHFPTDRVENKTFLKPPPRYLGAGVALFFPIQLNGTPSGELCFFAPKVVSVGVKIPIWMEPLESMWIIQMWIIPMWIPIWMKPPNLDQFTKRLVGSSITCSWCHIVDQLQVFANSALHLRCRQAYGCILHGCPFHPPWVH